MQRVTTKSVSPHFTFKKAALGQKLPLRHRAHLNYFRASTVIVQKQEIPPFKEETHKELLRLSDIHGSRSAMGWVIGPVYVLTMCAIRWGAESSMIFKGMAFCTG